MTPSDTSLEWHRYLAIVILLAGCHSAPTPGVPPTTREPVSVKRLGRGTGRVTFEMRNISSKAVAYAHWFGLDSEPVPYCKFSDSSVRPCGTKVMLDEADHLWIHERYLKPGRKVRFVAQPEGAIAVGVLLWTNGKETFVWSPGYP